MGKPMNQEVKIKLYLLAVGLLILAFLLVRDAGKEKKEEPVKEEGPFTAEEDLEPEPEEEEPQVKLPVYNGKIRVLLKTDEFAEEVHASVQLASDQELAVLERAAGEETGEEASFEGRDYGSGTAFSFAWEDGQILFNGEVLADAPGCFTVGSSEGTAGIRLESVQRNTGVPVYEGSIEVWPVEGGFVLVNEVPLETYLKYVTPSEMPSRYDAEALKAQAVCARTYAYRHMQAYGYPEYEAHVDDSVRYQVYNNTGQAESTSQAVAETADQILTYEGQPITAYYFSTSCGYTGNEEIWWNGSAELTPYLKGKTINEAGETLDLTDEEAFAAFIGQVNEDDFDSEISWYRWETEVDVETLSEHLNEALEGRCQANPEAIRVKRGRNFVSRSITSIGKIQGIDVLERNEGGAVQRMLIRGSKRTIEVETEYNVRALLNAQGCEIRRHDGSTAEGGTLLPSACMVVEPVFGEDESLTGFRFRGGGYGHGVGMSQNGANGMAKRGKTWEEILCFFYTGVELTEIGSL